MSVTLEGRLRDTIRDGGNPSSTYHYANVESYSGESQDKYIITSVAAAEMTECLLNDTYYGTSYKLEVFAEYSGTLYSIGYFDGGSGNSTRSTIYNFVLTANEETKIKLTNDQPTRIQVKPLSGYWNVLSGIYATNQPYLSFNTAVRFSNPTAPTQVLVSKSAVAPGEAVTLSWSGAKPGTRNPIKQYEIYRATSQNGTYSYLTYTSNTSATVYASNTLAQTYYYKIKAIGTASGFDSPQSTAYASVFSSPPAPSKPTGVTIPGNDLEPGTQIGMSWTNSTADPSNPISGYQIQRSANNTTWENYGGIVSVQPISVVSPTAHNTSYYYRVIAVGQYSNSDPSDSVELRTTVGALAAPANVKINNATSSTVSPATVTNVTWEQVSNATNNHVTGYFIYSSNTATGTYTQIGEVSNNVFTFEVTAPLTVQTVYYKVAAKGYLANGAQSSYVSLVVSLTTADASQFSLTSSSVYAGDNLEITITTNTAASHKIKVAFFNETSGVIEMAAGAITHAYTIPMEWLNNLPDSTVGQASLTVETYDGDVLKGARSTTFNILVPLTVLPTIASFTGTRVDNGVPPAWGVYVVSKSQVLLEMGEASGAYGSTIVGFRLTGAGMNITSTMPITRTSPVLPSTSNLFTASVTDTRGRTNNYTLIINAFAYAPPTLGAETYRCDVNGVEAAEGTYGSAKLTTTFSPVDGKNAVTLKAEYRVKGSEEAWTNISGITNGVAVVFGGALDINNYYDVRYTVTDLLGTTVMFIDDISTAKFILHFKEGGDGLGIGGTSSDPRMVDVHWGMKVRENLDVDGTLKKSGTDVSLHGHRHSAEDIDGMVPGGSTYATFYVNDQMELVMVTEDNYTGVTFRLVEGRLEVVL